MSRRVWSKAASTALFLAGAWIAHVKTVGASPEYLKGLPLPIARALGIAYAYEFVVYGGLLLAAFVAMAISLSRTKSERLRAIRLVLDALQVEVMKIPQTYNPQDYRVTLFRHRRWSMRGWWTHRREFADARPWSGWLVPTARSGDEPFSSMTRFFAPRRHRQGIANGHGVCGTAWLRGSSDVSGLPAVERNSSQPVLEAYGTGAHISAEEAGRRAAAGQSLARAMFAERVRTKLTPRWGVLVYDSVDPAPVIDDANRSGHKVGLQSLTLIIEEYA